MDATLLEQIRHLCRDRAAYERLKAILVQQERLHQLGWEERYKNLVPVNLVPAIGVDTVVATTGDRLTESEDLAISGSANFGNASEATNLLTNIIIREKAIAQLTDAIQRSPSLDLVLQIAVQVAQKLLQVDRVAIFRRHTDGRGEFITDAIATGVTSLADMPERQLSLARHLTEAAAIEHNIQTIDNIRSSSLSSHIVTVLEQIGISSYAANKIYAGQELWGTLVAFHGSFYHGWTESDRTSLSLVASQISVAIAIGHLRQQSQTLSNDVKSLQHELDKLQTTVSEIIEQQKLVKPEDESLNESIDELIEEPIEQQQAALSNSTLEEIPQELLENLPEEVMQEYIEVSVEVMQNEGNIPPKSEGTAILSSSYSNETEAIAVEVIQSEEISSEEISENANLLFSINPLPEENTYLSEQTFQGIPQEIQEHISEWLGQEPLTSDQAISEKDNIVDISDVSDASLPSLGNEFDADVADVSDASASNIEEINESISEDDQNVVKNESDSNAIIIANIIANTSNDLAINLEQDCEDPAPDIVDDAIQESSQYVAIEHNLEDDVENNIEMIEDIKITFPLSRNGLPPLFLIEKHNHPSEDLPYPEDDLEYSLEDDADNNRNTPDDKEVISEVANERSEDIPQTIESSPLNLATPHLPATTDDSSDDRDPAIEPQFIETILAIAGNGAKAHEFLLDVIDDYCEEAPRLVQAIDRAIASNEQVKLLQLLNTLRTASEYIGALSVAYQCRQLESAVRANYVVLIYASLSQVAIESQRALDALRVERSRYSS